jgi:hypothetical protein
MHFSHLWKLVWPALFLSLPFHIDAAERWKMQFYYNKDQSILDIRDLQCPSAQRCIAAGVVIEKNDHEKGTVLVTSDGGKQWSTDTPSDTRMHSTKPLTAGRRGPGLQRRPILS